MTGELLNWIVALVPVLVMLALFEWLDVFHLLGLRELLGLLLIGGVAALVAYPLSGRLLDAFPLGFSSYSRLVAPWIEEALKCVGVVLLFARNRVGFKLDAIISGFAIGAGFSVIENILYLSSFATLSAGVWMVRGLGTALMHGGTTASFAAVAHQLSAAQARRPAAQWRLHPLLFLPGYAIAVGIHLLYNQFPDRPALAMLTVLVVVPLFGLALFQFGQREAEHWLDAEAREHERWLADLHAGRFPATPSGDLLAELAARLSGAATAAELQRYLRLHTELVLRAEALLRGESNAAANPQDAARLLQFDALRAKLGRTTLAMVAPILPFSREELWEMDELRRKVRHGVAPTV